MVLLSISDIVKRYGPEEVLLGATCDIRAGDRIGLVGPNGCGKTTFGESILKLTKEAQGQVIFNGQNIIFFLIMFVLIFFTHRENIKRLINKEESKTKIY